MKYGHIKSRLDDYKHIYKSGSSIAMRPGIIFKLPQEAKNYLKMTDDTPGQYYII
jgi:hypothetical protein